MPSCSSFLCVCVAELWTVLETSSDSVCSFSSLSSLGSLSLFTSFTAEAHSVFSCDYVHSVHEFTLFQICVLGPAEGLHAVLDSFLVYLRGLWMVLTASLEWLGCSRAP